MKNLFLITILAFSLVSLNSCVSISSTIDDDVYVMKGAEIPVDESLEDETSYSAYKYKKDRNNNNVRYASNSGFGNSNFRRLNQGFPPYFGMNSPYYMNYYYGNSPFSPSVNWGYRPGFGWTVLPYCYNYGYPYYYNPYMSNVYMTGYYNYNGMYMVGNGYEYGYMYGNNPYLSNYQNGNSPAYGGNTVSNSHSGPRGNLSGGGVITRNSIPGTLKSTTQPVVTSTPMTKPVGQKEVLARNSSSSVSNSRPTVANRPTTENTSYSRPGRIENSGTINGRSYSGTTLDRTSGVSGRNGSLTSPSRNSSWDGGSRSTGTIQTSSSRSTGTISGGAGGNSGGARNSTGGSHSGGSIGGARR